MHNLIRYYYRNKYKIWGVIAFIVLLLLIIQVLNRIVAITTQNEIDDAIKNNTQNNTIINNPNTDSYLTSDKSAVTGEKIDNIALEYASETIENFVSACNTGNIEKAYSLISQDCKAEFYPTISDFKNKYYNVIFCGEKKTISIENWILNTYKINISEDIMATGNTEGMKIQDHVTIVKEDDDIKLNINNFVKKEKINREQISENIKFTVISKKVFMDYEEYEIKVDNLTNGKIILDSRESTKTIYVQDENSMKYYSYSNELINSLLTVNKGFSTQLKIKFYKSYSKERVTNNIVFSDISLYDEITNQGSNIEPIKINL